MTNLLTKILSRKLWMAIAGVATGIAMALGANATDITSIAGGVVALVSCVTYIVTEGKIDAEGVKNTVLDVQEAIDTFEEGGEGK